MNDRIINLLDELSSFHERHREVSERLLRVDDGNLWSLDLLVLSAMNRSVNLISAFTSQIEDENFIAAAPLLRLQLDNAIRISAAWLVDNPHEFAEQVIEGKYVSRIKDRNGKKMYDRYLVDKLSERHPWVEDVYEHTSGYVHLSDKHFYNAVVSDGKQVEEGGSNRVRMKIALGESFIPEEVFLEAIHAFGRATGLFLSYVEGWIHSKENPDLTMAEVRADPDLVDLTNEKDV